MQRLAGARLLRPMPPLPGAKSKDCREKGWKTRVEENDYAHSKEDRPSREEAEKIDRFQDLSNRLRASCALSKTSFQRTFASA